MTTGLTEGRSPRAMALDLVGRINKQTGRREGGIVGLTSEFKGYVDDMEAALRSPYGVGIVGFDAEGKPIKKFWIGRDGKLKSVYTARDKRFDGMIRRAIKDQTALKADDVKKMSARYSDILLKQRGENIARTEVLSSLHHAQDEGLRQMVDAGRVRAGQITRTWDSAEDSATRFTHRAMDNQKRGLDEPFKSPNGPQLMHPGDRSLGAPASEIINCRCRVRIEIDFLAELGPGD